MRGKYKEKGVISVWEPRYRDKMVLVKSDRIEPGKDLEIEITKGFYKGKYTVDSSVPPLCKHEKMETKRGGLVDMTIIPLDKLMKQENDEERIDGIAELFRLD